MFVGGNPLFEFGIRTARAAVFRVDPTRRVADPGNLMARPALRTPKKKTTTSSPKTKKTVAATPAKTSTARNPAKVASKPAKKPATKVASKHASLEAELARLLADSGTLALATARSALGSPSMAALGAAAEALAARGQALLFATPEGDVLSRTWSVLEAPVARALRKAVASASEVLEQTHGSKARRQLARESLRAAMGPIVETFATEADPRRVNPAPLLSALDELAQVGPPDADAVSVPALVLFLVSSGTYATPREALAAVVFAAGLGYLQLLPDGGLGLLADVDAELCPRGSQGTPLRWARRADAVFTERRPTSLPPSRATDAAAGLELERVDAWSAELFDPEDSAPKAPGF
jgi:hypothetical protein